ncbi:DUF397 domain-containing protein [Streptomyces sp. NPDC091416]|uniref:DUF397 domain-containing protein n=1 Tax=Streptomyces sp. NPDC091416 TaxID=3366003 RepID=UPI00380526E3
MTPKTLMATDLPCAAWRKSSYSGAQEGQCVEVANVVESHQGIAVRDSKDPNGPALLINPASFAEFIGNVANGRFNV